MPIEHELGTLIRRMNPYTDGTRGSMHFVSLGLAPVVAPPAAARAAAYAAEAATAAADHARRASAAAEAARLAARANAADDAFGALARALAAADAAAEEAANAAEPLIDLSHIEMVVDDFQANYSSVDWVFRGQPQTVKRALRITYRYRYPVIDAQKRQVGPYATEHVLVGYAGGNGSG